MAEVGVGTSITMAYGRIEAGGSKERVPSTGEVVRATITAGAGEIYREGIHGSATGDLGITSGLVINRVRLLPDGRFIVNIRGDAFPSWIFGEGAGKSFYLLIEGTAHEFMVQDSISGGRFITWVFVDIPAPDAGTTVTLIVDDSGGVETG